MNMIVNIICVFAVMLLYFEESTASLAAQDDVRPVTIIITAVDPDGEPIPEVPLQCLTLSAAAFGVTDAAGRLVHTLDVARTNDVMVVRIWDGMMHRIPYDLRVIAERRVQELPNHFAFKAIYLVPLTPEQDEYTLQIAAERTVRIQGRLVDANGEPVSAGTIGSFGYMAGDDVEVDDEGRFEYMGTPRGRAVQLFAQQSTQVHIIELSAQQTLVDLDLGDVPVPDPVADAPVRVMLQNHEYIFDSMLRTIGAGATLVSTDGALILGFPANAEGDVVVARWHIPPQLPYLPAAEYYVVPGSVGSDSGMALLRSVRAGRQAQLDAAGVPKITAVTGEEAALTLDARAVFNAVIQVGGDLVD